MYGIELLASFTLGDDEIEPARRSAFSRRVHAVSDPGPL
jgi:hypothetical protein